MSRAREYKAGTKEALVELSGGVCYFPDCERPVIEFVEGHPMMAVEVSHIHAAKEGGPYYDEKMNDDDRRHFDNLLLLCKPHHTLVDKREPENYPADVRRNWKQERESKLKGKSRLVLEELSANLIADAIESLLSEHDLAAVVVVELQACIPSPAGLLSMPFTHGMRQALREQNEGLDFENWGAIATARNKGSLPVDISSWEIRYCPIGAVLMGRSDYPSEQILPQRLEVGAAVQWRWSGCSLMVSLNEVVKKSLPAFEIQAVANLATGEVVCSETVGVENLPLDFDMADVVQKARQLYEGQQNNEDG